MATDPFTNYSSARLRELISDCRAALNRFDLRPDTSSTGVKIRSDIKAERSLYIQELQRREEMSAASSG